MNKFQSLALTGLSALTLSTTAVAENNSKFNIEEFQNKVATDVAIGICKKYDEEFENQKTLCNMNLCKDKNYNLSERYYLTWFLEGEKEKYRYMVNDGSFFRNEIILNSTIPKDDNILNVNSKYIITILNEYKDKISNKVMQKISYSSRGCVGVIDEGLKNGLIKIEK